jgi:hypothetical protein
VHSVLETPVFSRRADSLLSREERGEVIEVLARQPLAGVVIPGTGGVRKLRSLRGAEGRAAAFA